MNVKTAIILTFSKDDNRGANLQAYALKKSLEQLGVDVRFLDIQLPKKKANIKGQIVERIKNWCAISFRKRFGFKYTEEYTNAQELCTNPPKADLFIVGSDQVWNPDITKKLDPRIYFFSFLSDDVRRISYAASFGKSQWNMTEYDNDISVLLSKFYKISVREDSGIDICKDVFGISNVDECVDPSLLLSGSDLLNIIGGRYKPQKHIYSYLLYKSNAVYDIIDDIACQTNLRIVGEYRNNSLVDKLSGLHGIETWIRNIAEAALVVTNSFHTTVVSILLHKNFVVVPPVDGRETRLISLLSKLGVKDRYIGYNSDVDINNLSSINYDRIDSKITELKRLSLKFIADSIK